MSGRSSRQKGCRVERELKQHFEGMGYKSLRVPLSGAAQGYKGDVIVWPLPHLELPGEVKARRNEFKNIYAMVDSLAKENTTSFAVEGYGALVSYDFNGLGFTSSLSVKETHTPITQPKYARTIRKLIGMHKYIKECAFLAIKINNKPFLFIRYIW